MGGALTVRSDPGAGSAFFLWLPGAAEEAAVSTLSRSDEMEGPTPDLLLIVREGLLAELERILHAYVARLRSDPAVRSAHALDQMQLEDHLATFLSDLAETFTAIDLAAGADTEALRDSTAIQRTVADRHGRQRRRLGWAEDEVRREFEILREEISAAVRRRLGDRGPDELDGALDVVAIFVAAAEKISLESFRQEGPE